jgi:hypothetical protein
MKRKETRMKAVIALAAATALSAAVASAAPIEPKTTTICLDVSGRTRPATCHYQSASRLDKREDICQCMKGGQEVKVDVCPSGVRPPSESAAYERERYALVQHGSLVGQSWHGRPVCVSPHEGSS